MTADPVNVARQRDLYGEPLADISARLMSALGLNQGGLAKVLGLSAPMLSQLLSAQRVKIGNPVVLHRLQELSSLADVAQGLPAADLARRLEAIRDEHPTAITRTETDRRLQAVEALRSVSGAEDLRRGAEAVASAGIPALAALLREAAGDAEGVGPVGG